MISFGVVWRCDDAAYQNRTSRSDFHWEEDTFAV